MTQNRKHIISLVMENESGTLSRIAGLFSARGYNIRSLNVAQTEDPSLSRMTIVTHGDNNVIQQITKQLNKLIDVVKLHDISVSSHLERELLLVKVLAEKDNRQEIKNLADIFRAGIIDVTATTYTLELTGTSDKLDALLKAIPKTCILEVVRSGPMGIARGTKRLSTH